MEKSSIENKGVLSKVRNGETLVHTACRNKVSHFLIPAMLNRFPNDVRSASQTGDLPLHVACNTRASLEIVELLVSKNRDALHICNKDGNLPLHLLVEEQAGGSDLAFMNVLRYLVEQLPDALTKENINGETPFDLALSTSLRSQGIISNSCTSSNKIDTDLSLYIEMLEFLTPRLPTFQSIKSTLHRLPLHYLVTRRHRCSISSIELLVQHHSRICQEQNQLGELPLHLASRNPGTSLIMLELLFRANPDAIQMANREGLFPFQMAATATTNCSTENEELNHLSVVYFLVHRSLFAFENLVSLREILLNTRVGTAGSRVAEAGDDRPENGRGCEINTAASALSRTLKEILEEHRAEYEGRVEEMEQVICRIQEELEQDRNLGANTLCCRIS
jgi:ankyrin repeat protein